MKRYLFILAAITTVSLVACKKKDVLDIKPENAVYMGNQSSTGVVSITVNDETGGEATVTPRLADIANKAVTITIGIDEKLLQDYNKANNLQLETLSPQDFKFITKDGKETHGEVDVTIESGQFETSVIVKMDSISAEKYPYSKRFAIPVIIKKTNGYKLLSSPQWTIIALNRQIKTSVGKLSGGGIVIRPKNPFTEPMQEWTFQMSALYSTLTRGNLTTAYMSAVVSGEFYTRINQTQGIQVKNGRDGDDTWTQKGLKPLEWLNISYVYKEGSISVYVNGEFQKSFQTTPIYFKNDPEAGWTVGNGGYNNDYLREIRFWNKALTQAEIVDKLYLPQDPKSPGLLMYLPLTKEEGLKDLTDNWDVVLASGARISYTENVIFPAKELVLSE